MPFLKLFPYARGRGGDHGRRAGRGTACSRQKDSECCHSESGKNCWCNQEEVSSMTARESGGWGWGQWSQMKQSGRGQEGHE